MESYEAVKSIGGGSYGDVILVRRKVNGCLYVCKTVKLWSSSQETEAENEVHALGKLNHPCIIHLVEAFAQCNALNIVMEYADAEDLEEDLHTRSESALYLSEDEVMRIFIQVALGLREIHRHNLLHRDLKTANVLLNRYGDVKMGDFGFAKQLSCTSALASTVCGTPYYFSPELCQRLPYNSKSDVWSLGVVLYELINLRKPFSGRNLGQLRRQIVNDEPEPFVSPLASKDLKSLTMLLLKKSSWERPSVEAVLKLPFVQIHLRRFQQLLRERRNMHREAASAIERRYPPPSETSQVPCDVNFASGRPQGCGGGTAAERRSSSERQSQMMPGSFGSAAGTSTAPPQGSMKRMTFDPKAVAMLLRQANVSGSHRGSDPGSGSSMPPNDDETISSGCVIHNRKSERVKSREDLSHTASSHPVVSHISDDQLTLPPKIAPVVADDVSVFLHQEELLDVRQRVGMNCPLPSLAQLSDAVRLEKCCKQLIEVIENDLQSSVPSSPPCAASVNGNSASQPNDEEQLGEAESEEEILLRRELGDRFVPCVELALGIVDVQQNCGDGTQQAQAVHQLMELLGPHQQHLLSTVQRVAAFFQIE